MAAGRGTRLMPLTKKIPKGLVKFKQTSLIARGIKRLKKYINFEYFENDFVKDEDQRNYIVSNKKIIEAGFKTKFSIEDGIKELIKTYKGINIKNYKNF